MFIVGRPRLAGWRHASLDGGKILERHNVRSMRQHEANRQGKGCVRSVAHMPFKKTNCLLQHIPVQCLIGTSPGTRPRHAYQIGPAGARQRPQGAARHPRPGRAVITDRTRDITAKLIRTHGVHSPHQHRTIAGRPECMEPGRLGRIENVLIGPTALLVRAPPGKQRHARGQTDGRSAIGPDKSRPSTDKVVQMRRIGGNVALHAQNRRGVLMAQNIEDIGLAFGTHSTPPSGRPSPRARICEVFRCRTSAARAAS